MRKIESEGRVLDTDLAKALGMERSTNIRGTVNLHGVEEGAFEFPQDTISPSPEIRDEKM